MVLQVFADARCVHHDLYAVPVQKRARANAGELQQLRRLDGAGRQQHLGAAAGGFQPPILAVLCSHDALPLEQQPGSQGVSLDT